MELRPVTFRWRNHGVFRDDGAERVGFVAHELQSVIPSAVKGQKDGTVKNPKGETVEDLQSIDPLPVLATLAKAIQELQAEVEATKASCQPSFIPVRLP
jgi:hypothetical protein